MEIFLQMGLDSQLTDLPGGQIRLKRKEIFPPSFPDAGVSPNQSTAGEQA
jgi:hypothetical protein